VSGTGTEPVRAPDGAILEHAVRFAEGFYRERDGETVVVGLKGGEPALAFAAGLRTQRHKAHLETLARYLFARDGVDAYLVIMPADLGAREVVALQSGTARERRLYTAEVRRDAGGRVAGIAAPRLLDEQTALLGDLLAPGQSLPGIMRRRLDQAYKALRIAFDGAG
jgi:hypothetical protein